MLEERVIHEHILSSCTHQECVYLRAHGTPHCRKQGCDGTVHAVASCWDDYSFGHAGGHVYFLTVCEKCNHIHFDGETWNQSECDRLDKIKFVDYKQVVAKRVSLPMQKGIDMDNEEVRRLKFALERVVKILGEHPTNSGKGDGYIMNRPLVSGEKDYDSRVRYAYLEAKDILKG